MSLVSPLNTKPPPFFHGRLARLVRHIGEYERAVAAYARHWAQVKGQPPWNDREGLAIKEQSRKHLQAVDRELGGLRARLRFHPASGFTWDVRDRKSFFRKPLSREYVVPEDERAERAWEELGLEGLSFTSDEEILHVQKQIDRWVEEQDDEHWHVTQLTEEGEFSIAFYALLRLAERGLVHRLRPCGQCGKWLFAKFERQRFCSDACWEKTFRRSPEGRAKRAAYMRRYRAQPSSRQEGRLLSARGKRARKR